MKNRAKVIRNGLVVLIAVGLLVTVALAQNQGKKAGCGSGGCGGAAQVAAIKASGSGCSASASGCSSTAKAAYASTAACSSSTACSATTAKACPVQQFMTKLSRVDLTQNQIQKMMAIWQETEKKMTALLTPTQMAKMKETLPIQSQLAAQVVAQVSGETKAAKSCGGEAKACSSAKSCSSAQSCSASGAKSCCGTCSN